MDYASTAETLCDRIFVLIPENPQILYLDGPWAMFKIPGFDCDDLNPSLAQACGALGKAKLRWRAGERP